jgi:transcriptional regulator with XRE-family HTH domain
VKFRKRFAANLKLARSKRSITQEQLAAKTNLRQDWISHFENGRRLPSLEVFARLSKALAVTADSLIQ